MRVLKKKERCLSEITRRITRCSSPFEHPHYTRQKGEGLYAGSSDTTEMRDNWRRGEELELSEEEMPSDCLFGAARA